MDLNHPLLALGDDPPPFPSNQPQLQRLDRALLCQICKEPFVGPVSIACGHSFCSQCIRSSLDTLKKCPSCGEAASEGGIRRNRALEEMVDAWEEARPIMITLSKPAPPKRRAEAQTGGRVKRLRLSDGAGANDKSESGGEGSRSRSGSARPPIPSGPASASGSASPEKEAPTIGQTGGVIELGSSDAEEECNQEDEEEEEVEELSENVEDMDHGGWPHLLPEQADQIDEGECPLCQARLPISSIPAHIERNCEPPKVRKGATGQVGVTGAGAGGVGSGNAKADWKKVFGGMGGVSKGAKAGKGMKETPLKRLTKLNFSLSPPSALRDFLLLHSLPTTGDRPTLEARVSEWTLLYNSNLDTSHPRSLPALRAKLAEAEAARKRDKEKGKDALGEKLGTSGGMKEYARERRGEFERLREVARRGMKGKGVGSGGERGQGQGEGEGMEGDGEGRKGGSEGAAIVVD